MKRGDVSFGVNASISSSAGACIDIIRSFIKNGENSTGATHCIHTHKGKEVEIEIKKIQTKLKSTQGNSRKRCGLQRD
jgi:hypothetical protein